MFFSSHSKASVNLVTLMGPVALLSLENYRGRFVLIPKGLGLF